MADDEEEQKKFPHAAQKNTSFNFVPQSHQRCRDRLGKYFKHHHHHQESEKWVSEWEKGKEEVETASRILYEKNGIFPLFTWGEVKNERNKKEEIADNMKECV